MSIQDKPVAAINWFSGVDYPGKLTLTIYMKGCPYRCIYCYNMGIVLSKGKYAFDDVLERLRHKKVKNILDGVVFSGGEPLLHGDRLSEYVKSVKEIGYEYIGLHTSGYKPDILKQVLSDITWVGLDYKGPDYKHKAITGTNTKQRTLEALEVLNASNTPYEVRTTVFDLDYIKLTRDDLMLMADQIKDTIKGPWVLQQGYFINQETGSLDAVMVKDDILIEYATYIKEHTGLEIIVRHRNGVVKV